MSLVSLRSPRIHRGTPALACAAFCATLLGVIVLGHEDGRVAQLMALAAPALAWLVWPVRSLRVHRLRTVAVCLWAMVFAVDGIVRAYLLEAYQAAPDSSVVIGAAANTNARESAEYLSMHWRTLVAWSGVLAAAAAVFLRTAPRGARAGMAGVPGAQDAGAATQAGMRPRWSRGSVAVLVLCLLAASVGFASKSWRRLHPVLFWTQWSQQVGSLRAGWADQQRQRDAALQRARAASPTLVQAGPSTIVLVLTDSINRDNMGLYGYRRATTPRLQAHKAQLQEQMLVMRHAWSVDASTLPSVHNILRFGEPDERDPHHVLALARAAGYKTWWMSNHDDIGIEQQHARMADVVEIVNRTPGRAGASLDGELLDCLQEALEDPTERKLIVVHFLGAHPHYNLRFPPGANPFDDTVDGVETELEERGRSAWVRRFRQEYDAAILYADFVVSQTLQLARTVGRPDGYRAWMFLSDHGQEVGHNGNHAGHSPQTASGYRIPALVWSNRPRAPQEDAAAIEARPFRTDWAAWTIADLARLRWTGDATERDALRPGYRWQDPVLPVPVASFRE